MADPRFLDAWIRGRTAPKGPSTLQVRLDAPGGVTYAPDQRDPHNSAKRTFLVPPLPEPEDALHDFESEIQGHYRAIRTEPTFVIGDEDCEGDTPAQQLAAEYRAAEASQAETQRSGSEAREGDRGVVELKGITGDREEGGDKDEREGGGRTSPGASLPPRRDTDSLDGMAQVDVDLGDAKNEVPELDNGVPERAGSDVPKDAGAVADKTPVEVRPQGAVQDADGAKATSSDDPKRDETEPVDLTPDAEEAVLEGTKVNERPEPKSADKVRGQEEERKGGDTERAGPHHAEAQQSDGEHVGAQPTLEPAERAKRPQGVEGDPRSTVAHDAKTERQQVNDVEAAADGVKAEDIEAGSVSRDANEEKCVDESHAQKPTSKKARAKAAKKARKSQAAQQPATSDDTTKAKEAVSETSNVTGADASSGVADVHGISGEVHGKDKDTASGAQKVDQEKDESKTVDKDVSRAKGTGKDTTAAEQAAADEPKRSEDDAPNVSDTDSTPAPGTKGSKNAQTKSTGALDATDVKNAKDATDKGSADKNAKAKGTKAESSAADAKADTKDVKDNVEADSKNAKAEADASKHGQGPRDAKADDAKSAKPENIGSTDAKIAGTEDPSDKKTDAQGTKAASLDTERAKEPAAEAADAKGKAPAESKESTASAAGAKEREVKKEPEAEEKAPKDTADAEAKGAKDAEPAAAPKDASRDAPAVGANVTPAAPSAPSITTNAQRPADARSFRSTKSLTPSMAPSLAPSVSQLSVVSDMRSGTQKPEMSRVVRQNMHLSTTAIPPSISDPRLSKKSWNAPTLTSYRASETLSHQTPGRDAGTQWERVSGNDGANPELVASTGPITFDTISMLFTPDPRPWRPYRFVRRSDPRQLLLFSAGTLLTGGQVRAAELAQRAASDGSAKALDRRSIASYFGTTENTESQAGVGVVYSPTPGLCTSLAEKCEDERAELNMSRRLERPDFLNRTTMQRAALRAVIAALEYVRWEEEGFDKIVIATHNAWLVRGITHDIWEWRRNGWTLTRQTPQGLPGDAVPDRDLWELLDYTVRQYEEIDCNCRFWHIPKDTNLEAVRLAEVGALKTNQHPGLVRWRKHVAPQ
ncbi:uncharacterized protein MJAP1_000660 [Malassezia japonica]|uniref:RNase H type-1 domain-containing protein n=1 Tax=Malassezia japonica TaxID=223818 RepID=A0AAF0EV61_9BASI|nr:uncharacterized protein MJAP1_000660 [Malassezia japonica]WFD37713.1 hypothetical protein MJAP1_000660 [Malassezia japonica]